MDIVIGLENTSITPNESNNNKTNFDVLYKNWGKLGNQEERRREILEVQKSNRNSKLDTYRGILDLVQAVEQNSIFRDYQRAYYRPSIYVAGFSKAPSYSEVLMMSEWMVEKPSDFETDWVVVPTPKGTRVLLVACNGYTRLFSKYGVQILACKTGLPGGNRIDPGSRTNCCVLDCFYQKKTNTVYILDILAWNSQPMTDGEFEFRDYWLRCQLPEIRSIRSMNKKNELNFNLLPKVSCDPESFNAFMMKIHVDGEINSLDGLLFYHKRAHYFAGETPLVGWLFPYMVPEVLGSEITVNPVYMVQKPENYTDQATFITEFNAKMEKKKQARTSRRNSARHNQMDTAEPKTETKSENSSEPIKEDESKTESMEAEAVTEAVTTDATTETAATEPVIKPMEADIAPETDTKETESTEPLIKPMEADIAPETVTKETEATEPLIKPMEADIAPETVTKETVATESLHDNKPMESETAPSTKDATEEPIATESSDNKPE